MAASINATSWPCSTRITRGSDAARGSVGYVVNSGLDRLELFSIDVSHSDDIRARLAFACSLGPGEPDAMLAG